MKTKLNLSFALFLAACPLLLPAQQQQLVEASPAMAKARPAIAGWGVPVDPDGDCRFFAPAGELHITVPGTNGPHDLAAEIGKTNAPRVLQPVRGDFVMQVRVDGRLDPGDASTLPGRTGYNGAGLILMADPANVVCLARAVLHREGGQPEPYANFEMRADGKLDQIGDASAHPLPKDGPVYLRLERRGQKITAATSADGLKWDVQEPKDIPAAWPQELKLGIVAISTSTEEFTPRFAKLQIVK